MIFWCFILASKRGTAASYSPTDINKINWFLMSCPCILAMVYSFILRRRQRTISLLLIISSILQFIILQLGSPFIYYLTAQLPLIILILVIFCSQIPELYNTKSIALFNKRLHTLFIVILGSLFLCVSFFPFFIKELDTDLKLSLNGTGITYNTGYTALGGLIPKEERDDIMCLNFGTRFFAANSLLPANKYPINYMLFGALCPEVRKETISEISNKEYKWIFWELSDDSGAFSDEELLAILDKNYEEYCNYGKRMFLYKKR